MPRRNVVGVAAAPHDSAILACVEVEDGDLRVCRPAARCCNREKDRPVARQELRPQMVGLARVAVRCREHVNVGAVWRVPVEPRRPVQRGEHEGAVFGPCCAPGASGIEGGHVGTRPPRNLHSAHRPVSIEIADPLSVW